MAYATIEDHISADKAILENPETSPQARRHTKQELHELEVFHDHHPVGFASPRREYTGANPLSRLERGDQD